jgi:hypothetical protein
MKLMAAVTLILLIAFTISLSADSSNADGYSHGTIFCLQGVDGSGIGLRLTQHRTCDREYPYLEIKIRLDRVPTNERISIGETNTAFLCRDQKSSCQQFSSGEILFNHFEENSKEGLLTNGWYELKSPNQLPETGRFRVDCVAPCG